ncbi:MAG: Fic family protein, partial [Actinomycetes bacterium]
DDGVGRVVRGAVRVVAESDHLAADGGRLLGAAPRQALARLHTAAAADLVASDQLGRPRQEQEAPVDDTVLAGVPAPTGAALASRLAALVSVVTSSSAAPALVLAAVAHAEVLLVRPFVAGNGIVARGLSRAVVIGRGLDPMGAAVPELALLADPAGYRCGLDGYRSGTPEGVAAWLRFAAETVVKGAEQGTQVADAVLVGRLPQEG